MVTARRRMAPRGLILLHHRAIQPRHCERSDTILGQRYGLKPPAFLDGFAPLAVTMEFLRRGGAPGASIQRKASAEARNNDAKTNG
jgi:hypothetical protein